MTPTNPTIEGLLEARRLAEEGRVMAALQQLGSLAPALQPPRLSPAAWSGFEGALAEVSSTYAEMRRYALDGRPDPSRRAIYDALALRLASMADTAIDQLGLADTASLRYNFLRLSAARPGQTLQREAAHALSLSARMANALLAGDTDPLDDPANPASRPLREALEKAWAQLFNRVWTAFPLNADNASAISALLFDETAPRWARAQLLGAVTLGAIERFDPRRLALLCDAYEKGDTDLSARALTGMALALWTHRSRRMPASLKARLDAAADTPRWQADVAALALELARTRATERLARHIHDTLLPGLLKMRPDLERLAADLKRESEAEGIDPADFDMDANPEWADMLRRSGLEKELQKLSEMQEDGADVMMGMMGSMKQFPFFHEVAAWFLPFHADHSLVRSAAQTLGSAADMLEQMPGLCDGDKYSMACVMAVMPAEQARQTRMAFEAQMEQMHEAMAASVTHGTDTQRRMLAMRNCVLSLYRFFKKFRRKAEFDDPFGASIDDPAAIDPALLPLLAPAIEQGDTLRLMAELYLRSGANASAARAFGRLIELHGPGADLLQKQGFAYKRGGNTAMAMQCWEGADLIDSRSLWTLRHLATAARDLGQHDKAADYCARLASLQPDSAAAAASLGMALLRAGRPDEATAPLFKAEFLAADSAADPKLRIKATRGLARALLLTGKTDKARTYATRLTAPDAPAEADDWMISGHIELADGNPDAAAILYAKAIEAMGGDTDAFARSFDADAPMLARALGDGGDDLLPTLVRDDVIARTTS